MNTNEIMTFCNGEFGQMRSLLIDDEPWFVGKDVAQLLGYRNHRDAFKKHIDDEDKADVAIHDGSQNRKMVVINESGLYSLILSSKLPGAKRFKHWVTSDVVFVFNFSPTRSYTDYGFLVPTGSYEVVLNTDSKDFGGNGFADDSMTHLTNYDPLYVKDHKEWLKLYIPARSAVVLKKI